MTGRILHGRYRLLDVLGAGGMAVVYRARDEVLERDVAVKVLRDQFAADPEFVRRFRQEARNAASLSHPTIATVYDGGVDGDVEYIVMQLVDGPNLEQLLAERGRLPVAEALRIGTAVAEALQAAHDRGIVHRDVKPANILLTSDSEVRVVDFGIARALGAANTTAPGLLLGSVQYCSPEQVLGEDVGSPSDIYSLGIVLYEMLTGVRPFDGPAPAPVALQRLHRVPPPPSEVEPSLPEGIDEVVMRAMDRDPARRYASAGALAGAIRAWWRSHRAALSQSVAEAAPVVAGVAAASPVVSPAAATVAGRLTGPGRDPGRPIWLGGGREPSRPTARRPRERRRDDPLAALLPFGALLFAVAVLWTLGRMFFGAGAVLDATGSPAPSLAAVAPPTSAPTPSPSPTPTPTASPSPTPTPTAEPTPEPTARPTPRPTPRATPRPTPRPQSLPARDPAETVARFYDLVEAHRFDEAAALWTARMRRQYPPDGYIDGRFSRTTRIDLRRNDIIALDRRAGTAVVAVDLIEYRTVEPSPRRFIGRWDLVLVNGQWLMDRPHF
ncbi:MAG TPA: protein kinase [Candidatus Limnocylindrales bacterium]